MKKSIKILLAFILTLSIFSYYYASHHDYHIHAINAGDPCPICGSILNSSEPSYNIPQCNEPAINVTLTCSGCGYIENTTVNPDSHEYVLSSTESYSATCTRAGKNVYYCSNNTYSGICNHKKEVFIPAIGHDYTIDVKKEATCSEAGLATYTCKVCNYTYDQEIEPLGHDYTTESTEPTCTEEGFIHEICSICHDEHFGTIPALGHDVELVTVLEPTCTIPGLKSGICDRCHDEVTEEIPTLPHEFPEQWEIIKEPTYFTVGKKSRKCYNCDTVETEDIPRKQIPIISAVTVGGVSIIAAITIFLKKKAAKKAAENIIKEVTEKELLKPSFDEKTIVTCMEEDAFYKAMKAQKYLQVVESEYDGIKEAITDNEPDLTIIDTSKLDIEEVKENIKSILEENEETKITLLANKEQLIDYSDLLKQLKEDKTIYNYGLLETNFKINLVKLVLPIMKPKLNSDESLENIGMVADVLGIPFVSKVINAFTNGRDIKETIEDSDEDGLSFVDKSTIISDLASILGLDTVSSVAGLVGDVDDIKSSLEAKVGGNEVSTTKDAVEDIVDVVSDIVK